MNPFEDWAKWQLEERREHSSEKDGEESAEVLADSDTRPVGEAGAYVGAAVAAIAVILPTGAGAAAVQAARTAGPAVAQAAQRGAAAAWHGVKTGWYWAVGTGGATVLKTSAKCNSTGGGGLQRGPVGIW